MGKQLGDADRPAARVGALGRAVLDAGDDGHRPQPRAQRRVGRRAREADRQRALRVRLVPPLRADVRQDRARHRRRRRSSTRSSELREERGVATDPELVGRRPPRAWSRRSRRSCWRRRASSSRRTRTEQLGYAIEAVFRSWNGERARIYRRMEKIPDDLGTAVNVQTMVFGNKGDDSGTGVAFTRDPATGENRAVRRLPRATRRARTSSPASAPPSRSTRWATTFPECHQQLLEVMQTLQSHYRDMCDIEFTIEQGRLFILQTRVGKRTAAAALRMAVEMEEEGLIDKREAVLRVAARAARPAAAPAVRPRRRSTTALTKGLNASPGRGGRQGLLHRRRRRGATTSRRARDPRAARDVARRPARHDRGRGHPHVARRAREPRRGRRPRHGHARGVRRRRARDRRRRRRSSSVDGTDRARGRGHLDQRHHRRGRGRRGRRWSPPSPTGPFEHHPRLGRRVPHA